VGLNRQVRARGENAGWSRREERRASSGSSLKGGVEGRREPRAVVQGRL